MRKDLLAGLIGGLIGTIGGTLICYALDLTFFQSFLSSAALSALGVWIGTSTNRIKG
jgi:tetrahydromethanopterin S-methyltransferase subunit D